MYHLGSIAGCRALLKAAEICDFSFNDPGIDFQLLERAEKQFSPRYRPTLADARRMEAQGIDWTDGYY